MTRTARLMMVGAMGLAMLVSTSAMAGGRYDDRGRYDNRHSSGRYDSRDRGRDHGRYDVRNRYDTRDRFDRRPVVVLPDRRPAPMPVYVAGPVGGYRPVGPAVTACTPRPTVVYTAAPTVTCTPRPVVVTRGAPCTTVVRTTAMPVINVNIIVR